MVMAPREPLQGGVSDDCVLVASPQLWTNDEESGGEAREAGGGASAGRCVTGTKDTSSADTASPARARTAGGWRSLHPRVRPLTAPLSPSSSSSSWRRRERRRRRRNSVQLESAEPGLWNATPSLLDARSKRHAGGVARRRRRRRRRGRGRGGRGSSLGSWSAALHDDSLSCCSRMKIWTLGDDFPLCFRIQYVVLDDGYMRACTGNFGNYVFSYGKVYLVWVA